DRTALVAHTDTLATRISERVGRCLAQAGLTADRIDSLFLTGGSTGLPHVRQGLTACLPGARVVEGDTFGSVGIGLTLEAIRRSA
ncbi:Hsp70 family protein, partial [Methylobacterium sp. WL122]